MEDSLYRMLESICSEVYQQGAFTNNESYPDDFFTVWNDDTQFADYYSNSPRACVWSFTINSYSTSPERARKMITAAQELLVSNGWLIVRSGYDAYSGSPHHTGKTITAHFKEKRG